MIDYEIIEKDDLNNINKSIEKLESQLIIFQYKLKRIIELILNKYQNRISSETLENLKELKVLYDVFEKTKNEFNDEHVTKITDDFTLQLNNKLDEIFNVSIVNGNSNNESIDKSILINEKLDNISNSINNKVKKINLSFVDGIKSKIVYSNEQQQDVSQSDELQIINRQGEDIFVLNGKEISDQEFVSILKKKF